MADSGDGSDMPSDQLRARAEESRAKLWFLLEADRRLVSGAVLVVILASILLVGYLHPAGEAVLRNKDPIETLFQGLLTATITGVTLVLTLNQLVLSQELGAVGDQRERMSKALAFREDAADAISAPVSPPRPAQFLRALVQVAGDRARDLRDAVEGGDEDLQTAVADLTDSLVENADSVSRSLDDAEFGQFEVISAALNFNYSWKIFASERIAGEYGDEMDEAAHEANERLHDVLTLFGPAREHFKTLYFQWELINLSRSILVAAVPALVTSIVMLVFFEVKTYAVTLFGVDTLVLVVGVAATIGLLPFIILLAYVLRIATITKHTLSIGPFILRETDQFEEVEWDRDSL